MISNKFLLRLSLGVALVLTEPGLCLGSGGQASQVADFK